MEWDTILAGVVWVVLLALMLRAAHQLGGSPQRQIPRWRFGTAAHWVESKMKSNRILTCTITIALVGIIPMSVAKEGQPLSCGNATITVSPARMRGAEKALQDFLVSVAQPNKTKLFKFSAENDLLQVRCETNRDGESVLLVNHYCSGSGCSESNFSIIDLKTHEVLLSANARQKGNHSAAESILGKKLKPFSCGHSQEGFCYGASFE